MKRFFTALLIGVSAGILDVIPMIIQGLNVYACISAFMFWVALGLIIPFVNWNMKAWVKGLLLAELMALPVIILILSEGIVSVMPIPVFSAFLGSLVGIAGKRFVK
jgi:hypothetical protein